MLGVPCLIYQQIPILCFNLFSCYALDFIMDSRIIKAFNSIWLLFKLLFFPRQLIAVTGFKVHGIDIRRGVFHRFSVFFF